MYTGHYNILSMYVGGTGRKDLWLLTNNSLHLKIRQIAVVSMTVRH